MPVFRLVMFRITWYCFVSSYQRKESDGIFRIPTWLKDNRSSFEYFRKITLTTSFRKARKDKDSSP